ncbi:VWA domain-containing protein [Lutimonas zeaxanthinifaciens]|uniref:VWA domain-containing protein n=1 Tax=Lutimonas zeaxanthinifaciens TaxID=3060215 RepID=UPI00265C9E27|nr:VWA domain-containing protein [Lutimonas sp. YSD2104]WKK65837.1 VWA domain-containing protein [Lutimonas sp. YSD2104]
MYQIEEPKYFYLFIAVAVLLVFYLLSWLWKVRKQREFASSDLLNRLSPQKSVFKPVLKMIFVLLGLSFLVIAMVNPKMGTQLKTVKRQGVDIVFALDVSKSMLAEDIAPNRLEKSKQIISKIIDKLGSDRVGIIVYAGNAYPLLPITTDHGAAKMFLQNANPEIVSSQGTAINEALQLSKTFFDDDTQTNRFLFIISDGEDHEENSGKIAKEIVDLGIRTYTIGVGSNKGSPIPVKKNGKFQGYKKDKKDEVVITKLNVETLKDIASNGDGKYIYGNKTSKTIEYVEELLLKADKKEFESKQFSDYKDQFQWFVGFGLLLLVLDVFLLDKKTKWVQKLNLFNER